MPSDPFDAADRLSLALEKLETLTTLALAHSETQDRHLFICLVMVSDYIRDLRQLSTQLSEKEACR
jgi:hypothetical protein